MSLYNALFGKNPLSGMLLAALGVTEADVPRFRDCYLSEEGDIVIHTRTGGGNRDWYDGPNDDNPGGPWNSTLRALPGFKYDADDTFDRTYANFHFAVPEPVRLQIELLKQQASSLEPPSE
jgi:hypothetical protein